MADLAVSGRSGQTLLQSASLDGVTAVELTDINAYFDGRKGLYDRLVMQIQNWWFDAARMAYITLAHPPGRGGGWITTDIIRSIWGYVSEGGSNAGAAYAPIWSYNARFFQDFEIVIPRPHGIAALYDQSYVWYRGRINNEATYTHMAKVVQGGLNVRDTSATYNIETHDKIKIYPSSVTTTSGGQYNLWGVHNG